MLAEWVLGALHSAMLQMTDVKGVSGLALDGFHRPPSFRI